MLVLSRKCEESLILNGEIEIKIIEIMGDKVRLGVEAPKSCKVLRKELVQIMESNKQAMNSVDLKNAKGFFSEFKKAQHDADTAAGTGSKENGEK